MIKQITKQVFLTVLSMMAIVGIAVGCSNQNSIEEDITASIETAWNETVTNDDPAFLQEITQRSSYEIISIEESDSFYTINVTVKGINLGNQLKELSYEDFPEADDEDAMNDYLLGIITNCDIIETSAVIYAEPSDEGYEISFSDTFVDAMSGKIYSYYMDLIEDTLEG